MEYATHQELIRSETTEFAKLFDDVNFSHDFEKDDTLDVIETMLFDTYCSEMPGMREKMTSMLVKKFEIYFFILVTKIRHAHTTETLQIMSDECGWDTDDKSDLDDEEAYIIKQRMKFSAVSWTAHATAEIFRTCRITHVRKYIEWCAIYFQMTNSEIICCSIILHRLCELKMEKLYRWLGERFDAMLISIIIVIRKIYGNDIPVNNYQYAHSCRIDAVTVNSIEIVLIMLLHMHISNDEYENYLENFVAIMHMQAISSRSENQVSS